METRYKMVNMVLMSIVTAALTLNLTACSDDLDIQETPSSMVINNDDKSVIPNEQTNDAMGVSVTNGMKAAVLSNFDGNSMGAALVRRLPAATASVGNATQVILVKGNDVAKYRGNGMKHWASVYLNGGNIAVENPTGEQLTALADAMSEQLTAIRKARLTADGDIQIKPRGNSAKKESYEGELLKVRTQNVKNFAATRSSVADPQNDVVAEMVIFSPEGCYMYATADKDATTCIDQDGNISERPVKAADNQLTPYRSGLKADGAARWLMGGEKLKKSLTRASAEAGINELMGCSDKFTIESYIRTKDWEFDEIARSGTFTTTYRIWGVNDHSNNANTDYYYVKQSSTIRVGGKVYDNTTGKGYHDTYYWGAYDPVHYRSGKNWENGHDLYYGSWLNKYETWMELTGSGNITTEYALPGTDNNSGSKSIAIGTSHSETNTVGFSFTGMFSGNPGASLGLNYSHGWTDGTSFTMTNTTTAKELKVAKNSSGNKITWTYENSQKVEIYKDNNNKICHTLVPDAVINDVDVENQACWSVKNPNGSYTINVYNYRQMACLTKKKGDGKKWTDWTFSAWRNDSYTLIAPNRAEQTWHFDVTPSTLGQEGHNGDKQKLTEALMTQFPDVFQTLTRVADRTVDSENAIQYIVEYAKQVINDKNGGRTMREYALDLGCNSYTIRWYCMDGSHNDYTLTITAQ
ncbi:MAG: hypothetical protein J5953_01030 [Prevotella sp.]|nr:hypothetical protein [Prevotella sp.]